MSRNLESIAGLTRSASSELSLPFSKVNSDIFLKFLTLMIALNPLIDNGFEGQFTKIHDIF